MGCERWRAAARSPGPESAQKFSTGCLSMLIRFMFPHASSLHHWIRAQPAPASDSLLRTGEAPPSSSCSHVQQVIWGYLAQPGGEGRLGGSGAPPPPGWGGHEGRPPLPLSTGLPDSASPRLASEAAHSIMRRQSFRSGSKFNSKPTTSGRCHAYKPSPRAAGLLLASPTAADRPRFLCTASKSLPLLSRRLSRCLRR